MSDQQPTRTFTCANCHGTFEQAWTDDDALAEAAVHGFDVLDPEDQLVVCDECFTEIMAANDHPIGEHRDLR